MYRRLVVMATTFAAYAVTVVGVPRPVDVAGLGHAVHLLDGGGVHEDGDHEEGGGGPRRQRDDARDHVGPELGRGDSSKQLKCQLE